MERGKGIKAARVDLSKGGREEERRMEVTKEIQNRIASWVLIPLAFVCQRLRLRLRQVSRKPPIVLILDLLGFVKWDNLEFVAFETKK